MEGCRVIFCRTVAAAFFGNNMNNNRTRNPLNTPEGVFKKLYVVSVKRAYVFKAKVNKEIVGKEQAF